MYCFIPNYAAVPVELEVIILQYISWCVLIVRTFVFNQFSCFCPFLMDIFCYSIMSLDTLGRCHLLTCCSNVLDRLRFFSASSAQLIGVGLLQNTCIFLLRFVSITWSCIAVEKPSVSANRSDYYYYRYEYLLSQVFSPRYFS